MTDDSDSVQIWLEKMSPECLATIQAKLRANPALTSLEQTRLVAKAYLDDLEASPERRAQSEERERAAEESNARYTQDMNKLRLEREAQQELARRAAEERKQRAKDKAKQREAAVAARIAAYPMAVQREEVLVHITQLEEELKQLKGAVQQWDDILERCDALYCWGWADEYLEAVMAPPWPTTIDAVSDELDKRCLVLRRLSSPKQACDVITAEELEQWFTSEYPRRLIYTREGLSRRLTKIKPKGQWQCSLSHYSDTKLYAPTCEKSAKQCMLRHRQLLEQGWVLEY
jgi:hypothetical protein